MVISTGALLGAAAISGAFGLGGSFLSNSSAKAASASATQGAKEQNQFNAAQAQINRDFQERMTRNKHQYQVADLKAAGLNPILSATAGAAVPSGSSAQGVNVNAHKPVHAIAKQQLLANIASTAADIYLKTQLAKTEETKQNLNKGRWGFPGVYSGPSGTAKSLWQSKPVKKARTAWTKLPAAIKYWTKK